MWPSCADAPRLSRGLSAMEKLISSPPSFLKNLVLNSLAQYRKRLRASKGEHPWLSLDDQALLEKLGGWRTDRESGKSGLTLAGLLMFGKSEALRAPQLSLSTGPDRVRLTLFMVSLIPEATLSDLKPPLSPRPNGPRPNSFAPQSACYVMTDSSA